MNKYTFKTKGPKGSPRSYTKSEDKLTVKEQQILLADLINHFNSSPDIVKTYFVSIVTKQLSNSNNVTENNQT